MDLGARCLELLPFTMSGILAHRLLSVQATDGPVHFRAYQGMDKWDTFCSSLGIHSINSMNHTTGSAEMVEPLARFLIKALKR